MSVVVFAESRGVVVFDTDEWVDVAVLDGGFVVVAMENVVVVVLDKPPVEVSTGGPVEVSIGGVSVVVFGWGVFVVVVFHDGVSVVTISATSETSQYV